MGVSSRQTIPCMARNVISLDWKDGFEFYGSPASLYSKHTDTELGMNIHSLNNAFYSLRKEGKPLQIVTKTGFTIRKGEIFMKETEGKLKVNRPTFSLYSTENHLFTPKR